MELQWKTRPSECSTVLETMQITMVLNGRKVCYVIHSEENEKLFSDINGSKELPAKGNFLFPVDIINCVLIYI
jgi:hypothetical protein